jgi:hypothetical protein
MIDDSLSINIVHLIEETRRERAFPAGLFEGSLASF